MALNALAIDVMLPALPYMGEASGISHENERQLVVGAYARLRPRAARLRAAGRPLRPPRPAAVRAEHLCRLRFAATFAPNFAVLLALRLTQGLGAAATAWSRPPSSATAVGRDMAEVMSLIFMVFMAMPIIAPGVGRYCCSPARGSRSSCSWPALRR